MKIAYASDLHLEFGPCQLVGDADVLILAGDICVIEDIKRYGTNTLVDTPCSTRHECAQRYERFFRDVSKRFKYVFVVMGNHEFYGGNFVKHPNIYREALAAWGSNIYLLEDDYFDFDEFRIVGSTLWTDCDRGNPIAEYHIERALNDYTYITTVSNGNYRKLRPADTVRKHIRSYRFLQESVQTDRTVIVVTHHAPSYHSVPDCYRGDPSNHAYASSLEEFILDNPNIRTWIHGHMHEPVDYEIDGCKITSNPRGYYGTQTPNETHKLKCLL